MLSPYFSLEIPRFDTGELIPKVIHQIYLRGVPPKALAENIQFHINANPSWRHELYDSARVEEFILEHYGLLFLNLYKSINPEYGAARADLFRYLLIYRMGGVYLDIKSRFTIPIDEVLRGNERYVISQWRNCYGDPHQGFGLHPDLVHVPGGEFQVFHVIAAQGHPFLRAVIERVIRNVRAYRFWHPVGRTGVLRLSGPIAYTLAIYPILSSCPHTRFKNESELSLEPSILENYDHQSAFKNHYSTLRTPVVLLPQWARPLNRLFVLLRERKAAWASHNRTPTS
jgi:mannosyltransferase OCH1-like enzyme